MAGRSDAGAPAVVADSDDADDMVLELRTGGRSFGGIAKRLGYDRTGQVVVAFNRSLRRKSGDEQERLRQQEADKLQAMTAAVEGNEGLDDETRARRLAAVERMRVALYAD